MKNGGLHVHSSAIKPYLTEQNMTQRIEFCKDHIDRNRFIFKDMMDVIHVDEKCFFFLKMNTKKFYLGAKENEPHQTTKSK